MSKNVFNVTSFNQAGGITAGEVIIGPQNRRLTDATREQLKQALPVEKSIRISAIMGDGEAFQFADEIKFFLENEGYSVSGVDQVVFAGPVSGQLIQPRGDTFEVIIGTRTAP